MAPSNKVLSLTPDEAYVFITDALSCKQVLYIAGPPAIGKSQVVHKVAADANAMMIDVRLSQMLSEDMTGVPERTNHGKASYLPFDIFPLEGDPIPTGYKGWLLFLDELSSATEEVLAAAYSLLLDFTVGGKKLHPKCLIVAAGNRACDSAIARDLPDTIITRVLPVEMKVNHSNWIRWAKSLPENVRNDAVISYIERFPNMLYAPTKAKEREELETYPTPRGWEKVFAHVNLHEKRSKAKAGAAIVTDSFGVPVHNQDANSLLPLTDSIFYLVASAVGPIAARAFRDDYDEAISLPYEWEIAQAPSSIRIPSSNVGKAKIVAQLSDYFVKSPDQTRDALLTYINRIGGEYSELFVKGVKNKTGSTQSDLKMISEIQRRLSIDPILGTSFDIPGNPQ